MVPCSPTGFTVSSERQAAIGCWCLTRLASTNGSLPGTTNRHTLLVPFLSGGSLIFRFKRSFPCHMHCKTCSFVCGFISSSIDRSFKGHLCRDDSVCGFITSSIDRSFKGHLCRYDSLCGFITSSIDHSFKGHLCRVDSVCGLITSSTKGKCSRSSSFRPVACVLVDLGVRRRNVRAADKMQIHTHKQTHTAVLSI